MPTSHDATNPSVRPVPAGRRHMFALAAGAATLAAAATAAASEAEPLEQLWREYQRIDDLHNKAAVAVGEAEDRAFEAYPPRPKILYGHKYGTNEYFELTVDQIEQWRRASLALGIGAAVHERQVLAWNEWQGACRAIHVAHDVDRLDDEADAAGFRLDAIIEQIVETPPRTLRGVQIKLMLVDSLAGYEADSTEATLIVGLIAHLGVCK